MRFEAMVLMTSTLKESVGAGGPSCGAIVFENLDLKVDVEAEA